MYFVGSDTIKEKCCCDGTPFVVYMKPTSVTSLPTIRQILKYDFNWSGKAPLVPTVLDTGLLDSEFGRRRSGLMGPQVVRISASNNEPLCVFSFCRKENYLKGSFLRSATILRGLRDKVEWGVR
jgi:hypothetical protein